MRAQQAVNLCRGEETVFGGGWKSALGGGWKGGAPARRAEGRDAAASRLLASNVLEADREAVRVVLLVQKQLVLGAGRALGPDLGGWLVREEAPHHGGGLREWEVR